MQGDIIRHQPNRDHQLDAWTTERHKTLRRHGRPEGLGEGETRYCSEKTREDEDERETNEETIRLTE